MSKATKRKHVTNEVINDYVLPENGLQIVKVVAGRGNNLHEVENANNEHFLVSMPTKFRKNVWIKRGDFVMVQPIVEGDKVQAEITHILYKPQIQHIRQQGLWPKQFDSEGGGDDRSANIIPDDMLPPSSDSSEEEEDDDDDTPVSNTVCNPNRPGIQFDEALSSDSDNSDSGVR